MKRSLLVATGIITAILVLTAGAAQLTLRTDPHCDLTGLVTCTDATLEDGTLIFSLTTEKPVTDLRVTTQSSCGETKDNFIPEHHGPLTVEIACPGGVRVAQGDLAVIYDVDDERLAQSGTFATH